MRTNRMKYGGKIYFAGFFSMLCNVTKRFIKTILYAFDLFGIKYLSYLPILSKNYVFLQFRLAEFSNPAIPIFHKVDKT